MAWTGDQIIKFSKSDKDVGTDNRLSQTDKRLSVADNIIKYIMGGGVISGVKKYCRF